MVLTEEQRKRIEENRKRALEIRKKKEAEKKESTISSSVFDEESCGVLQGFDGKMQDAH